MITAEISLVPVGSRSGTSMSKEIALAFDAISGIKDLRATLTPLDLRFNQIVWWTF